MTETRTLYDRLGGTPGIEAIVDAVVAAHAENPTIKARFLPYLAEPARLSVIKRHTVQFFELGSGGYTMPSPSSGGVSASAKVHEPA